MRLIEWLEDNCTTDDCIPGAFYNSTNGQWVVYDRCALVAHINHIEE